MSLPIIPGYLRSKKGLSDTYNSTAGTRLYSLRSTDSSTGSKVVIDTFNGTGNGELKKGKLINPIIPYRVILNDYNFYNQILRWDLIDQPVALDGSTLLFNPNFSKSGSFVVPPSDFQNGDTNYIELNLTRYALEYLQRPKDGFNFQTNNGISTNIKVLGIKAYDTQSSIIVHLDDTQPESADYIILLVISRIDMYAIVKNQNNRFHGTTYSWAIPTVLQYLIDKNDIVGDGVVDLTPKSWCYPSSSNVSQITPSLSDGGIESDPWNYKIIPVKKNHDIYWPISIGCVGDIVSHSYNEIACISSVGRNKSLSGLGINLNTETHFSYTDKITFSNLAFVQPSQTKILTTEGPSYNYSSINIERVPNYYISYNGVYENNNTSDKQKKKTSLSVISSGNLELNSFCSFYNTTYPSIDSHDDTLYLKYVDKNDKTKVYKFSSVEDIGFKELSTLQGVETTLTDKSDLVWELDNFKYPKSLEKSPLKFNDKYISKYDSEDATTMSFSSAKDIKHQYLEVDDNTIYIRQTTNTHSYITKDVSSSNTSDSKYSFLKKNILKSQHSDGLNENQYSFIRTSAGSDVSYGYNVTPSGLSLGQPVLEYWRDPTFGNDDSYGSISEGDRNGVKLMVNITGCYGIWSKDSPFTVNSFNTNLRPLVGPNEDGGVQVEPYSRLDLDFEYAGDRPTFIDSTGNLGYRADIYQDVEVSLKNSLGDNLIYGSAPNDIFNIHCAAWKYNHTGYFNLYVPLDLDLSNAGADVPFTHPDFVLSGCSLTVSVNDRYGSVLASEAYTIDIDPPDADGDIISSIYKTIDDSVDFTLSREANSNASDYTELHNVTKHFYNPKTGESSSNYPYSYKDNGVSSATITLPVSDLDRGSYCYISYEPKLYGIKPAIVSNNGVAYTNFVSYCKGHRYSLDNVELYIGAGGSYGSGLIDSIQRHNPYVHLEVDDTSLDIKLTCDINHETWDDNSSVRSSYSDANKYPCISGIYIMYIPITSNFLSSKSESIYSPYDDVTTYPNIDVDDSSIKDLWLAGASYVSGYYFDSDSSNLSSQDVIISGLSESNRYRIFLSVEDEFGQFSNWCVTNPYTFRFPF